MPATPYSPDLGDPGRNRWPGSASASRSGARLGGPRGAPTRRRLHRLGPRGARLVGVLRLRRLGHARDLRRDAVCPHRHPRRQRGPRRARHARTAPHGRVRLLWRPALRTVLLCLVVPAVVWNADQRGLHDVFSGTVLVRTS
ncbi:RDD family protein [Clavibacter tessellarius]|uniref:RDD family protein n=1 Tax=Clavibacter tessellarius TaxID=31965 RepID=UPI00324D0802